MESKQSGPVSISHKQRFGLQISEHSINILLAKLCEEAQTDKLRQVKTRQGKARLGNSTLLFL